MTNETRKHTSDELEVMERFSITFDGETYRFEEYRYDKLLDAVNYAKQQRLKRLAEEGDMHIGAEEVLHRKEALNADIEFANASGLLESIQGDLEREWASDIILTTSMFVASRDIEKELDVITAECVYGMNIFRDLFAGVRDIVGGRSNATEKVLRDARIASMNQLRATAFKLGADAVIAIDLDYVELTGGGKNGMLLVVVTGTAVKLKTVSPTTGN